MARSKIKNFYAPVVLVVALGLNLSLFFTNCSPVSFDVEAKHLSSTRDLFDVNGSGATMTINDGAKYTTKKAVTLKIAAAGATEMAVTNSVDCAGPLIWEKYQTQRSWNLGFENQNTQVFVRVKGPDFPEDGICVTDDILHDDIAPVVLVQTRPKAFDNVKLAKIEFLVSDNGSGVASTVCRDQAASADVECQNSFEMTLATDGSKSVAIVAKDKAGNVAQPVAVDWTADFTAPSIKFVSHPQNPTADPRAILTYLAQDSVSGVEKYECRLDAGSVQACGTEFIAQVADGAHAFHVRAYDRAGNQTEEIKYEWVADLTAPTVQITGRPANPTNATQFNFTFTGQDGAAALSAFECRLDSVLEADFASCSSPKSYASLSEGTHVFSVRSIDRVGNKSAIASYTWVVDRTAPVINFTTKPPSPSGNVIANFGFTAVDSLSGVQVIECSLDNTNNYSTCTSPRNITVAAGSHYLLVRARDRAGNTSAPIRHDWTVDVSAPMIQFTQTPVDPSNAAVSSFAYTANDDGVAINQFECRLDSTSEADFAACSGTKSYTNLSEGRHNFYVRAVDTAGNKSAVISYSWLIDRTAPNLILVNKPPAETRDVIARFQVSANDSGSGVQKIECAIDGGAYQTCELSFEFNVTQGAHYVLVRAIDNSGNTSAVIRHDWLVDLTQPTVQITSGPAPITNQGSAQFTISASGNNGRAIAQYFCKLDTQASFVTCPTNFLYPSIVGDGPHSFSIYVIDAIGNTSNVATYNWSIDRTVPVLQIVQTPPKETRLQDAKFVMTVNDGVGSTPRVMCRVQPVAFEVCSLTKIFSGLSEGNKVFEVYAEDAAGNRSAIQSYAWLIDRTPPTVKITSAPPAVGTSGTAQFAMTASANNGRAVTKYMCRLDSEVDFQPCTSSQSYSGLTDGERTFFVYVEDAIGNTSAIVSHKWIIDRVAPQIVFTQVPVAEHSSLANALLEFNIVETGSGVRTTTCRLNTTAVACAAAQQLNLGLLAEGSYTFSVNTVDRAGNASSLSTQWRVVNGNLAVKTKTFANQQGKIDVLVVVDNSGSMKYEQSSMAQRFSNFLSKLNGLDWQVAIATTDVRTNDSTATGLIKDGRLLNMTYTHGGVTTNPRILNSSMDFAAANEAFSATIQRPASEGGGKEQGIRASYRAIERVFQTNTTVDTTIGYTNASNVGLFRTGSSLAVVVVSDADETPSWASGDTGNLCKPWVIAEGTKNHPKDLVNLVSTKFPDKPFKFYPVVVKPDDQACREQRNDGSGNEAYGCYYNDLRVLTGGRIGSVCETDYTAQLAQIGQDAADLARSYDLGCAPYDVDRNGQPDITVVNTATGAVLTNYVVEGKMLVFNAILPVGNYRADYRCVQ